MFLRDNRVQYLYQNRTRSEKSYLWLSFVQSGFSVVILLFLVGNATRFISFSSIRQPVWWLVACLWVILNIFVAALQISPLRHTPFFLKRHELQQREASYDHSSYPSIASSNSERLEESAMDQFITLAPQVVDALEMPFQHMGVRTEEHRQEIEKAVNALYCQPNFDKQVLYDCLQRLLQAARQSWTELAAFSPREREVLELLLQNISYREMGSRLHVSISTVKTHVYHIFQKLNITTREEAIHLIREHGWFYWNERDS